MHSTTRRLFEAVKALTGIDGFEESGKVAQFMGESPATITNWKSRGVSKQGNLKANKLLGIDASWLSSGQGSMLRSASAEPQASYHIRPSASAEITISAALNFLQSVLDSLTPILKDAGLIALRRWLDGQSSLEDAAATLQGLQQVSAGTMPASKTRAA